MIFGQRNLLRGKLLAAALCSLACASSLLAAPVRLFSGNFELTNAPALARAAVSAPVNGLFLVQFTGHVRTEWRAELATRGVELLRYFPDDAFVAHLHGAQLDEIARLKFITGVTPFRAEWRQHPALNLADTNGSTKVSVLLAASASASEVAAVREKFFHAPTVSASRAGKTMRGEISRAQLAALAADESVLWLAPVAELHPLDEVASKIVAGDAGPHITLNQFDDFDGQGVTVAVADTGLDTGISATMHQELANRVLTNIFYSPLTNAADYFNHGTGVAGCIAGSGSSGLGDEFGALYGLGIAPTVDLINQRIFNANGLFAGPNTYEELTHDALRAGAVIGNNSWGGANGGLYDSDAHDVDILVRDGDAGTADDQPLILIFSAGNSGSGANTVLTPGVAKNVITVGGSLNARTNLAGFNAGLEFMYPASSRGPTADGRLKPDLVAPAAWVATLQSSLGGGGFDGLHVMTAGTSFSAPQVSGAAAAFVHFFRDTHTNATPSPALVKAAFINAAHPLASLAPAPNPDEGWGRCDLGALLNGSRAYDYFDQAALLTNSQVYERTFVVNSTNKPLLVTLAYTDFPGNPGSSHALVNDLDLEIISPDNHTFRGNQFDTNGISLADTAVTDSTNNVEGIHLVAPVPGQYTLRVRAVNVPEDSRADTADVDQDFALVISGDIPLPGAGAISLDRQAYTAPDQIQITVTDAKRASAAQLPVRVKSSVETAGENYFLAAAGSGSFTGAVTTVTGAAVADGQLQIAHGSSLTVEYLDIVAGTNISVSASADLVAPTVSGVTATNSLSRALVRCTTSETTTLLVRFGVGATLNLSATNLNFTTNHTLALGGLQPGQNYFYIVIATDAAGNRTTNDHGGARFTFTAPIPAPVLLVDAYTPDLLSPEIPLSSYTDSLATIGARFDVWPVATLGAPDAAALTPYRALLWRVSDSYHNTSPAATLDTSTQLAVENFVTNGGGFFMASMEILARLGETPFRSNVLQVAAYGTNDIAYLYCASCDENGGVADVAGASGENISVSQNFSLDYSSYPTNRFADPDQFRTDLGDTFTPSSTAVTLFTETNNARLAGIRWPLNTNTSAGKVVFLAFPLDAVPETNRAVLLARALTFLAPGFTNLPGTIQFTNNLWEGVANVTGPLTLTRAGIGASVTGAPAGTYVAQFSPVAFYATPASQTNTLAPGGTISFTGNYAFTDANTNGIADAWEQFYFGSVTTNRTALTDTDADGATDRAEFLAGTNPTNAASVLRLTATLTPSNTVSLAWPSVLGRAYCPLAASDAQNFFPLADWATAFSTTMNFTQPATNQNQFFRVQVAP
ncbi:MAG: hypothetical protein RLZZ350_685 [Verrucomicrobiota bacterium]|jgi:hypothetical protein